MGQRDTLVQICAFGRWGEDLGQIQNFGRILTILETRRRRANFLEVSRPLTFRSGLLGRRRNRNLFGRMRVWDAGRPNHSKWHSTIQTLGEGVENDTDRVGIQAVESHSELSTTVFPAHGGRWGVACSRFGGVTNIVSPHSP